MTPGKTLSLFGSTLAVLLFALIFWLTLAPAKLGGPVSYVIVDGNSMEPGFHLGDLVLVRTESSYGVGDAVVYRNGEMNSFVFHRIIAAELDRFILQGDHNSWVDSYQPTQDEIVGKLWVRIPRLGTVIEWMRAPLNFSITLALLGAVFMYDTLRKPRNEKGSAPAVSGSLPDNALLYGLIFINLVFLVLGIYSFTRKVYVPAGNIPYQQDGFYFYSATGTPGVYDTDVVRSGEPIFPKLTCFLNIGYTYTLVGNGFQGVNGVQRMYARIMDEQSGWQRTIPLTADTAFTGSSFFTMSTLDLCEVEALVNLVEEQAGLKQISYTLEIITDTAFTAALDGSLVTDSFSPALVFKYDKIHFYLDTETPQADPLHTSKGGLAGTSAAQVNTIVFLGLALPVWLVRFVSLFGFGLSAIALGMVGMNIYKMTSQSEEALIRLKYGGMMVDVFEQNFTPPASIVDLASMDDLARIAERHGVMILHMVRNFLHFYFVQSNGSTYRYVITDGKSGRPAQDMPHVDVKAVPAQSPIPAANVTPAHEEKPIEKTSRVEKTEKPIPIKDVVPADPAPVQLAPVQKQEKPASRVGSVRETARNYTVREEAVEYVIDTGEIGFALSDEDATLLRKIQIS